MPCGISWKVRDVACMPHITPSVSHAKQDCSTGSGRDITLGFYTEIGDLLQDFLIGFRNKRKCLVACVDDFYSLQFSIQSKNPPDPSLKKGGYGVHSFRPERRDPLCNPLKGLCCIKFNAFFAHLAGRTPCFHITYIARGRGGHPVLTDETLTGGRFL